MEIRKRFPNATTVRTCKQKSKRHRYYATETKEVMRLVRKMRGSQNAK